MASVWKPALRKVVSGTPTVVCLPRPVLSCSVQSEWKQEKHEVPLRPGVDIRDVSVKGQTITISGNSQIDGDDGSAIATADAHFTVVQMIRELETIRTFLCSLPADGSGFDFIPYWSSTNPAVLYDRCFPVSFNYDIGDGSRTSIPYSLVLALENPTTYFYVNGSDVYSGTPTKYGTEFLGS